MKQPESLRLAKLCDAEQLRTVRQDIFMHDAAKELRRLQAEVERLNVTLGTAYAAAYETVALEFDRRGEPPTGFYDPHEPAEIIRNMATALTPTVPTKDHP